MEVILHEVELAVGKLREVKRVHAAARAAGVNHDRIFRGAGRLLLEEVRRRRAAGHEDGDGHEQQDLRAFLCLSRGSEVLDRLTKETEAAAFVERCATSALESR